MEQIITKWQQIRFSILANCKFDLEKANSMYNFVLGNKPINNEQNATNKPVPDGVYYVLDTGGLAYLNRMEYVKDDIIGVAVKMGEKIATIALHDAAEGEEIPLVTNPPCGTESFCHPDFFDAITDWNGEANTKNYGEFLNPAIHLKEGEYIPSLAQLHLILLNIKEVNKALEAVGGTPMKNDWYWSSTEHSAYGSWVVNFFSGGSGSIGYGKYVVYVVRPAVALSV